MSEYPTTVNEIDISVFASHLALDRRNQLIYVVKFKTNCTLLKTNCALWKLRSLLKSVTWLQGLKSLQHSDLQRIKEEACWEGEWGNVSCLLDLMSKNRQWLGSLRMPSAQGQWLILGLSGSSREEQACVLPRVNSVSGQGLENRPLT